LLDVVTQRPLEEVALDYLTDYVMAVGVGTFQLKTVVLKSQQPLLRRQLHVRRVQEAEFMTLRVVLSLIGFSVGMDTERLTQLLVSGVDSRGFTDALQASSQFYATAQASSAVLEFPKAIEMAPSEETNPPGVSSTIVTFVVIAGLCVALAAGFFAFRHYQRNKGSYREESVSSQGGASLDESSPRSANSIIFSQGASSTPRGARYYPEGNLLGSLDRSMDSDEYDEDTILTEKHRTPPSNDDSDRKRKAEVEDPRRLPLPGNVPAMVVIDNIEDGDVIIEAPTAEEIVPAKRVSMSFAQAFSRTSSKPLELLR
jgi:hypothetical protein